MPRFHSTGAIILAGGKSSRMGQDKGLMFLDGKPMIQYVIDVTKKITTNILIVANNKHYQSFGLPVVKDIFSEKGPLGGVYTGLTHSPFEYNLVLSCDVPYLTGGVLESLLENCTGFDITVAQSAGKIHPLIGVYRKTSLVVIEKNLHSEKLKLMDLFADLKDNIVEMNDFLPENFRNINSPGDL